MHIANGIAAIGLACAFGSFGSLPARAVVAGQEGGPAAGSTLMVLNARGGVGTELRVHGREGGEPVLVVPSAVAMHPEFDAGAIRSRRRTIDLALVRLAEPLPGRFSAAGLVDGSLPRAGSSVTLAGYGVSREGEARSTGTYRSAALTTVEPYGPGRILLWAADDAGGGKRPGAGACQGDSGGPIFGDDGIVAVTSWSTGPSGRQCGLLSQGVLVAPQRGWIDSTLSKWGESARWTRGR